MPNKNFLLLSLEDEKIKKISNVISNESCRKILDFLSTKEATESELASNLSIPISTVHYNLQQLIETGLISAEEFHYSKKGKEVSHYKLANKYIIISPKKTFGIKEKLKSILPVVLIVSGVALAIQFISNYFLKSNLGVSQPFMAAKSAMAEKAVESAAISQSITPETAASSNLFTQNFALWFFIGALFALLVYFVYSLFKKNSA